MVQTRCPTFPVVASVLGWRWEMQLSVINTLSPYYTQTYYLLVMKRFQILKKPLWWVDRKRKPSPFPFECFVSFDQICCAFKRLIASKIKVLVYITYVHVLCRRRKYRVSVNKLITYYVKSGTRICVFINHIRIFYCFKWLDKTLIYRLVLFIALWSCTETVILTFNSLEYIEVQYMETNPGMFSSKTLS